MRTAGRRRFSASSAFIAFRRDKLRGFGGVSVFFADEEGVCEGRRILRNMRHPLTPSQWLPKPATSYFPDTRLTLRVPWSPKGERVKSLIRIVTSFFSML